MASTRQTSDKNGMLGYVGSQYDYSPSSATMGTQLLWSILLLLAQHATAQCPCMVDHTGVLTCEANTINDFPGDMKIEVCNIHTGNVRDISLARQTFTDVNSMAFADFPNLEIINLAYNEIEVIHAGAFVLVPKVREINLRRNNIKTIEAGVFDDVVKLSNLDLRDNPVQQYETSAWHFCERTKHDMSIEGDIEIYKNLQQSNSTQDYCNYVQNVDAIPLCSMEENSTQLDCSGQRNLGELACHLTDLSFETIVFDFPADYKPPFVENFFEGESNGFIMDFNSISGSENHTKMMEKLTLFNTKFDLTKLANLTSNRTKEVILKADTVFITEPLTIDYRLTIHARVVALNTSIQMLMSKNNFLYNSNELEPWAFKEETVSVGKVIMRTRRFGLIDIVDHLPEDATPSVPNDYCKPVFINSTETSTNVTSWFDSTFINLNYVCARTLQSGGSNLRLATDMANFTLNFAFDSADVQDRESYMAAQKFKRIIQAAESPNIHNVPSYSINTVSELAGVMVDRMTQYRVNEIAQEEQLFIAQGRVQDMQIQFDIILQQQQMYFALEETILDAIWAATDNAWDFSFDHRNGIEDTIMGAMNASAEAAFEMQEQEYMELLAKAQANVEHMEDVVEKYQSKLERIRTTAEAALDVQHSLSQQLQPMLDALDSETEKMRQQADQYLATEAVGMVLDFFACLADSWFWGWWSCAYDFSGILDLFELSELLDTIVRKVNGVIKLLEGIDMPELDKLSDDLTTEFKSALHEATELVKNGPTFDQLKSTAQNRMPGFSDACENNVDVSGMMEAMSNVADTGHALTEATSKFADVVLELANTKDELRVAQNDVDRAIKEVQRIKEMLDEFEEHRDDYLVYMAEAQLTYEYEVNKMKSQYHNMSDAMREEYKDRITASFQQYQQVFLQQRAQYNSGLSQLITSITEKSYGLKSHSMTQRGMILSLYIDFCDAYFYHSFSVCDETDIPLMSDSFELLLEKLSDIKWDSVTSDSNLEGVPIDFGPNWIIIEDQPDLYKYPVRSLRNTSQMDFNLKDYDEINAWDRFWRIRLDMLRITLLDETDHPIPSPGQQFGQEIQSLITFPTVFNDTTIDRESHTFLCQNFYCTADYVTSEGNIFLFFHYLKYNFNDNKQTHKIQ